MELNREQIIKALECCTSTDKTANCPIGCPYGDINSCEESLMYHALALIKELTEENERLSDENYRLSCDVWLNVKDEVIAETIEQTKKATVKQFAERLKAETITIQYHTGKLGSVVLVSTIDQIAKEMLEGLHHEETQETSD